MYKTVPGSSQILAHLKLKKIQRVGTLHGSEASVSLLGHLAAGDGAGFHPKGGISL